MIAQFKHQDPSMEQWWKDYNAYINTSVPLFVVVNEIVELMDKNNTDYYKVPKRHTRNGKDVYFKFNSKVYDQDNIPYKLFTYERVYLK
ncbi:DUF5960 family protein [Vagococcus vulneris]|uniref:Uncharacterized protein n=1 Tax=Vagococcus vulneris TaxID=1977869 RepID=A0A429ZR32_9ENTE|nr:DUF5960 family protein [Vagococcus vulneris]RST96147.1 hypothetical protein CBF37_11205 [Vagococcus vulneris]